MGHPHLLIYFHENRLIIRVIRGSIFFAPLRESQPHTPIPLYAYTLIPYTLIPYTLYLYTLNLIPPLYNTLNILYFY